MEKLADFLTEQILNTRKVSMDGSKVTYDLSSGVDFSKPRKTGEALASVIFDQDVSKWIKIEGDKLSIVPTQKIEIRVLDSHNKEVGKTVNDFKKDLENDEIKTHYSNQVEASATYQAGMASYLFLGIGTTLLMQHMARSSEKSQFLSELMGNIMPNITVSSLQM